MKERPILFSAPMVRALLDGSKTQTRRAVSPRHLVQIDLSRGAVTANWSKPMPYGQPGDQLWVRESFSPYEHREGCWYWADGRIAAHDCSKPKPSIHMFRWASRISLEITGVRVERLHDISEADAVAEGIRISSSARRSDTCYGIYECLMPDGKTYFNDSAYTLYHILWEQINGAGSWATNPWVWVIEFKPATQPKDTPNV